jgi:hypothetical protein
VGEVHQLGEIDWHRCDSIVAGSDMSEFTLCSNGNVQFVLHGDCVQLIIGDVESVVTLPEGGVVVFSFR